MHPAPKPSRPRAVAARVRKLIAPMARGVDHGDVQARVLEAGKIGGGYLMMTAISAAIALLGLLLSSPAVVIGAMLLSPLMGPIVLLGFAFWTVDWIAVRKALISLGVGFGLALLVSIVLTTLSPLKEPTAEILSRSQPTLFDLMVAIFSGVAGGYAVVRQRGGAVIGVAIATALMPPLAAVGFGIGTRAWTIAGGAMLLFFTNLIAIALAAAMVAALSGFRPKARSGAGGWVRTGAVVLVLGLLCVPLTLSLGTIAGESRGTAKARAEVATLFGPKARIASLSVSSDRRTLVVNALVATPRYIRNANAAMTGALASGLGRPVQVTLDQVVLADPSALKPKAEPAVAQTTAPDPSSARLDNLRAAAPFPGAAVFYDATTGVGLITLAPESGLDIAGARALETGLRGRDGEQETLVIPPVRALAAIAVSAHGRAPPTLGPFDLQQWALSRWRAPGVDAVFCPSRRGRIAIARVRAAVSQAFAPVSVVLKSGGASVCAKAKADPPFVIVAPG